MSARIGRIELVLESGPGAASEGQEVVSMCGTQQPAGVDAALGMLDRALDALNAADVGSLPAAVQAEALRALGRAEAKQTAARARVLAAFTAQDGYEDDGHGSARVWLKWQTQITAGAAAGAVGWMRRLAVHPVIGRALAAGQLSPSWARQVCDWTDRLPADRRDDADAILIAAAGGGAALADLAGLAREMFERSRHDDRHDDGGDGFDERGLWLGVTWGGAGRLSGDLAPGCAAALSAVLEALGKKAGPEDTRTAAQRRHDALAEACRRLIAAGMVPGRAGQPTQILVHMGLGQLRNLPGGSEAEAAWRAAAAQRGWLAGAEAEAAACDATIVPIVTGHADPAALDQLAQVFLAGPPAGGAPQSPGAGGPGTGGPGAGGPGTCGCTCGGCTCPTATPVAGEPLSPHTRGRLRRSLLALATDALSGPGGLAAHLRAGLHGGPLASVSLPLDAGAATETIPAHLRRAATTRHPHCTFPGCEQPASVCEIHHLIPRAHGGPTALHNLVPLCVFHHLIVIHRWGWTLTLHPDGTTTATSPDGQRTFHSHSPPDRDHGPPGGRIYGSDMPSLTGVPGHLGRLGL
jgi:Domain of unknown function (DUF222)